MVDISIKLKTKHWIDKDKVKIYSPLWEEEVGMNQLPRSVIIVIVIWFTFSLNITTIYKHF